MMGDTAAVPLMDDMEEEIGVGEKAGLEAGLAGDFAYNNNVAGASKHVRLGAFLFCGNRFCSLVHSYILCRVHEEGVRSAGGATQHNHADRGRHAVHPRGEGARTGGQWASYSLLVDCGKSDSFMEMIG